MAAETSRSVIGLMMRLSKTIHRQCPPELLGMSLRGFVVLSYVYERERVSQQELGEVMGLDANSTVLLLHELEDDEFISRRRDPTDRRRHIIEITSGGREAFERAERGRDSIEDAVFAGLTAQERSTLGRLLAKALEGAPSPAPNRRASSDCTDAGATSADAPSEAGAATGG
jgi:DNA-binding MarR family transcriptional regulator